jgi:hypothetical protein
MWLSEYPNLIQRFEASKSGKLDINEIIITLTPVSNADGFP